MLIKKRAPNAGLGKVAEKLAGDEAGIVSAGIEETATPNSLGRPVSADAGGGRSSLGGRRSGRY